MPTVFLWIHSIRIRIHFRFPFSIQCTHWFFRSLSFYIENSIRFALHFHGFYLCLSDSCEIWLQAHLQLQTVLKSEKETNHEMTVWIIFVHCMCFRFLSRTHKYTESVKCQRTIWMKHTMKWIPSIYRICKFYFVRSFILSVWQQCGFSHNRLNKTRTSFDVSQSQFEFLFIQSV